MEHEDDGSGEDPYPSPQVAYNKQVEGAGKGAYKTRDIKATETKPVTAPASPTPTPTPTSPKHP
jgi:hypothetical protein